MLKQELLTSLLIENNGILKTSDAINANISKPYFLEYVKRLNLKRVSHGIYMADDAWRDEMYLLQLRLNSAIFSHESALYLLNLSEREPLQFSITMKAGYNSSKLKQEGIKVYTVKPDLFEVGLVNLDSPNGNVLRTYNAERTVCDLIRSRSNIEIQDLQSAIKGYTKIEQKNLPLLMRYAKMFRVEKLLRQYLEVLI
jgi:hypothetical protein